MTIVWYTLGIIGFCIFVYKLYEGMLPPKDERNKPKK